MKFSVSSRTVLNTLLALNMLAINMMSQQVLADDKDATTSRSTMQDKVNSPIFGINVDPIWLALSGIGIKAEYFISDTISIGIGGIFIPNHKVESTTSSTTLTTERYKWEHNEAFVGSNIMLTGTLGSRGLYINPAIGYQSTKISEFSDYNLSGSVSAPMARLTVGYQWIIVNHLRLAAGGGFVATQSSDIVVKDSSGKEALRDKSSNLGGLALDLQVGYVF